MGVPVVRCPKTQRRFSTGIRIERADFEHLYEDVIAAGRCPYCKIEHRWHYRGAEYFELNPASELDRKSINARSVPFPSASTAVCHKRRVPTMAVTR